MVWRASASGWSVQRASSARRTRRSSRTGRPRARRSAWSCWAALVYAVGTRLLPEPDTRADWGEVARTVGFAQTPGVLRLFGIIPGLGEFIRAAADVWVLIATVVAVRQALDYRSLPRAVGVCLIGWILQIVVFAVIRRALV